MVTTKTFWYIIQRGTKYVTLTKEDKIRSTTPVICGQLSEIICKHCQGGKNNRKVTLTLTG